MVTTKKSIPVLRGRKAELLAFMPAISMASASAYVPMEAGLVMPVLAVLIGLAVGGIAILRHRANIPAAPSARRRTRSAGEGPAGLLRELAKAADAPADATAHAKPALTLVGGPTAAPDRFPEPSLLPSIHRLSAVEASRIRLVTQAFEADRIELHLQPIVSLPQGKIRFYEVLARLRLADGTLLAPAEFLPVLECSGRAADFDRRILIRAMAVARHLMARGSEAIVGVNLSAHAIVEPGFLWSLAGLVDSAPEALGRIVLELPQHSWRHLDADLKGALTTLRERGVPFSLDRAADLRFDPQALADLGVRFMKLPADLLVRAAEREGGRFAGPEPDVRDFAPALRRQGIRLIAERVDRDEMVPVLTDLGIPLAQGFAFAAPRPVKPEIAGEHDLPQAFGLEDAPTRLRRAG